MTSRENGELKVNTFDLHLFFDKIMDICKNDDELNFVYNTICYCAEQIVNEKKEDLKRWE